MLVDTFQQYAVRMAFSRHDHLYERAACTYLDNTVRYIATGGGGAPLAAGVDGYGYPAPPDPPPGQTTSQEKLYDNTPDPDAYHFCIADVTTSAFNFKMYKWNGEDSEDEWP